MTTHLVLSAIGDDRPGIVEELARTIMDAGCNIEDSRMSVLGGSFAVILLISGQWNTVSKLESGLPSLERKHGLTLSSKRTEGRRPADKLLPYTAEVVGLDNPGIVHELASFFSHRGINIEDMSTSSYKAAHTATPMFAVHMTIGVPTQQQIASLREEFLDLCDQMNLDGVLEPAKH